MGHSDGALGLGGRHCLEQLKAAGTVLGSCQEPVEGCNDRAQGQGSGQDADGVGVHSPGTRSMQP